jgi:photosystem II stability/assembly factor-like uncharacterized protein
MPVLSSRTRNVCAALLALSVAGPGGLSSAATATHSEGARTPHVPSWHRVDVDTDQELRGLAVLSADRAWVTGEEGGVWRTSDGGETWEDVRPPGAATMVFRDIEATDFTHVQVLAIGSGAASRIYRTSDGGETWSKTFVNRDPRAFYDCMAMWPGGRVGLAMSDPVDGRFGLIETRDSGRTWHRLRPVRMPRAVAGEYGFASSGTCLVTTGARNAYLATGGGASRIFRTTDRGRHWSVRRSTIPAAENGGVNSLAFRSPERGIAVGGDYTADGDGHDVVATTYDRGDTWRNVGDPSGYRSGVAWRYDRGRVAIAVGFNGSDISRDGGRTWQRFSGLDLDAVACVDGACWASGADGHVARLAP